MVNKNQYHLIRLLVILVSTMLLLSYCSQHSKLIKQLPPADQEFLSTVRYLITPAEKKQFLSLVTAKEREQFQERFWEKRDTDPATEENEFQLQYYARIEEANRLFSIGGHKGWLTDRGHVYILLGPPETKQVYPSGYQIEDYPTEVWMYGYFPVIFVDRNRIGDYELVTINVWHLAEMALAQKSEIPMVAKEQTPFGFKSKIFFDNNANHHALQITLPYRNIIFQKENDEFKADIIIHIEIVETSKKEPQKMAKEQSIRVKESDLKNLNNNYLMTVPLKLPKGHYQITVILENKADNIKVKDQMNFKVDK